MPATSCWSTSAAAVAVRDVLRESGRNWMTSIYDTSGAATTPDWG